MDYEERNEVWGREENRFDYGDAGAGTYVLVNGSRIEVVPNSSFREVVGEQALNAGFNKYRVFLNGSEVRPSQAPATVNEGDVVELRAYDIAG